MSWTCHSGSLACLGPEIKVFQKLHLETYHSLLMTPMKNINTTCCWRWKRLPPFIHFQHLREEKLPGLFWALPPRCKARAVGHGQSPRKSTQGHLMLTGIPISAPASCPPQGSTGWVTGVPGVCSSCTGNHLGGKRPQRSSNPSIKPALSSPCRHSQVESNVREQEGLGPRAETPDQQQLCWERLAELPRPPSMNTSAKLTAALNLRGLFQHE